MSDLVHRLRLIVAEPAAWCKTDVEYVEDAADEMNASPPSATRRGVHIARRRLHTDSTNAVA